MDTLALLRNIYISYIFSDYYFVHNIVYINSNVKLLCDIDRTLYIINF